MQTSIKNILNQLIDQLDIPTNKFSITQAPTEIRNNSDSFLSKSCLNYTVSYNASNNYDDEYINYADFERWSNDQNKVSTLK